MSRFLQKILIVTCFISFFSFSGFAQSDTNAETVVHLLSYVSMDYSGAVEDGEIIDEQEYAEQQEFSQQAFLLTEEGDFLQGEQKDSLLLALKELIQRIDDKDSAETIRKLGSSINHRIIQITGIQTAPSVWPNLENGKAVFSQSCASCHGEKGFGDGPAGKNLDPSPSNFHDTDLMDNFSPYQAFNSIRLGVPGTAMQAYPELTEVELWDLAFYVKSLRFEEEKDSLLLQKDFDQLFKKVDLADVANATDQELLQNLQAMEGDPMEHLAALRSMEPSDKQAVNSLPVARKGLRDALASYKSGDKRAARSQAINAYLEGIEPVEARLRTKNSSFVANLERQMFNVRNTIDKNGEVSQLEIETDKALDLINQADQLMKDQKLNYWLTFIIAASIFLREALEAFLIIFVVLALIRRAGAKKALVWLHGGWITAVLAGIAGWFLSDYILQFGGRNREVMEGLVSLLAVVVLLSVGFWLHNKSEAKQWTDFIKNKIGKYLSADRMIGLAAFSFFVVFREVFEMILFLQAVKLEASDVNESALGLGVLVGAVLIAIIAFIFLKYTKKLPIGQLFKYSSWIILLLAIILIGKGVHSLQESGWINITNLPDFVRMEWLGIYPTVQTVAAQIALILFVIIVNSYKNRKALKVA